MSLKEILVEALRAVDEAGVPTDLRQIAFEKAIDLAAQQAVTRTDAGGEKPAAKAAKAASEVAGESGDALERIAGKLKLDREIVAHVYNVDPEGNLEVVVAPSRLPAKVATAMREIALLVAAGRQAGGFDSEWTSADEIRQVCEHFKRFDSPNFASALKQMEHVFLMRGTSRKREVKMTAPAWVEATDLVKRLGPVG
jgi:hypothetical protein